MEKVKVVFGFIELAAAVKFLWVPDLEWGLGLMPRSVVMILFIAIGIGVILYLSGIFSPLPNTAKVNQKQSRGVIGIIITFIILKQAFLLNLLVLIKIESLVFLRGPYCRSLSDLSLILRLFSTSLYVIFLFNLLYSL